MTRRGAGGSVLLIDWDAATMGDRRLLAHLAPDEPEGNAQIICEDYLRRAGAQWCRPVSGADLERVPPDLLHGVLTEELASGELSAPARYGLAPLPGTVSALELRWSTQGGLDGGGARRAVSLREVIGALESYEPARITASALIAYERVRSVGRATLMAELCRVHASRIVLNRRLREAVVATVAAGEVSMSEIALRCGRVKRDSRGVVSGETTWLARRLGLVGDGASAKPTPWIHTEVLAVIARRGLGISPREVELA